LHVFLSFEVFDLQNYLCGYGSFLVEHGIGERCLGDVDYTAF